jgi:hypothetical protein
MGRFLHLGLVRQINPYKTRSLIYTRNVLDVDCQTQGRLKLMIKLYISEICHKFQ